jgi:hypothetical protein
MAFETRREQIEIDPTKPLSIKQWKTLVGTKQAEQVFLSIGSSRGYMLATVYRIKRPSYDFAKRLIEAAKQLTPDHQPDLDVVMLPVRQRRKPTRKTAIATV